MKWKLYTRNENIKPITEGSEPFDSKEAAMAAACNRMPLPTHVSIVRIEGPNGERIESKEIVEWCKEKANHEKTD